MTTMTTTDTTTTTTVRGLRNRNPGNLRHSPAFTWQGEIEPDPQGYCRFARDHDGLRAIAVDLLTKWRRGLRSVRQVIAVYAPPSENATQSYVVAVAAALDVKPDVPLELEQPGPLALFVKAVVRQECGTVPYALPDILEAVRDALAAHAAAAQVPAETGDE